MQNETDLVDPYKSYTAIDFVIGLLITLGASALNALGLNVTKLDHSRQESLPASARRPDYLRPFWWLGLILYIISQVAGSTLALEFLRAEYVAPLGSSSLVFNFVFAYILVGTPITRLDIFGTLVIVVGVVGVVVFGNIRDTSADEFDKESNLSLGLLKQIWGAGSWIAYFTVYEITTVVFYWLSGIIDEVTRARVSDERAEEERDPTEGMIRGGRRGPAAEGWRGYYDSVVDLRASLRGQIKRAVLSWSLSQPEATIRKIAGCAWSVTGGMLAGATLILAKSGVKLVSSAISGSSTDGNPISSPLTWLIIVLLVVSAVTQVVCLNKGLKCADSTVVVPFLFSVYTITGFINSLVYLDEFETYKTWVFVMIWLSIAVLSAGVLMVASKKPPKARPRAGSLNNPDATPGVTLENPFDDPVVLGAPTDEAPPGKRQGLLARLFGGSPADVSAALAPSTAEAGLSRKERRNQPGVQRLEDEDDRMSVAASQRDGPKELGAEEMEMDELDEVDALAFEGRERRGESDKWDEAGDDFGEFKEAK